VDKNCQKTAGGDFVDSHCTEQVISVVQFQIKSTDTLGPKYTGQIK